jgi:hypothetical protein
VAIIVLARSGGILQSMKAMGVVDMRAKKLLLGDLKWNP